MKLFTKLGIYALVFASCFSLQAKEDALLETQKNQAEAIVQQIRDIGNNNTELNATGREFTHLLWEASKNYDLLSAESKLFMDRYFELPTGFDAHYVSEDGYFKIFYMYTGEDAIPEDDEDNDGFPDILQNYARFLMDAKAKYVDFGLKMPYSNSLITNQYNVYISDSRCDDGVYGYTSPLDADKLSTRSYVVVRSDYSDFGWGKPSGFKDSTAAQITLAHEFQHSIQMGYARPNMSMNLMEGCAVWSEQFVYDGEQDPFGYVDNFLKMSYLGVNYDARAEYSPVGNTGNYNLYPYGSWVFFKYLTDMYGNQIIKELYETLAVPNKSEMVAFDVVLGKYGTNYADAAKNFFTAMIRFPSNPATKPIYFSRGDEIHSSTRYKNLGAYLTWTYTTKEADVITENSKTNSWIQDKKIFKRLSSRYFRLITDRGGRIDLTPEKTTDSLVLIVYQFKKSGDHTKFKASEVNAFGNSKVSLTYAYDPELPDVYIQLYNYKRQYTKVMTDWDMAKSTTYYDFSINPNSTTSDVEADNAPIDFSLQSINPMPATDNAVMNLSIGTPALMTYRIYDASGRTISNNSFYANAGQMKHDLNLNGLTAGVYFLEVSNGIKSEKINFIVK